LQQMIERGWNFSSTIYAIMASIADLSPQS
jgi:hypothetical protein